MNFYPDDDESARDDNGDSAEEPMHRGRGFLTLKTESPPTPRKPAPDTPETAAKDPLIGSKVNLSGSLHVWEQTADIALVIKTSDKPNIWNIEVTWREFQPTDYMIDQFPEDEHRLLVTDKVDDNGHHFIEFELNLGYSGGGSLQATFFGKKSNGEPYAALTEGERKRLNWDMESNEVERRGKHKRRGKNKRRGKDVAVEAQPASSTKRERGDEDNSAVSNSTKRKKR